MARKLAAANECVNRTLLTPRLLPKALSLFDMSYMYFDETIRDHGAFIIGALVISSEDLSVNVKREWIALGLDPHDGEYKSSDPKENSPIGARQRRVVSDLLMHSKLALVVLPLEDRYKLGTYCVKLISQLHDTGSLESGEHSLFLDQNIKLPPTDCGVLNKIGVTCFPSSDSKKVGGIQVADHAAHALGGMLLEEIGVLKKRVRAGENSGYHPEELLDLGFELWASLRYALIGRNEYIEGLSPHPDCTSLVFPRHPGPPRVV